MAKYICVKHGELSKDYRILFGIVQEDNLKRWCRKCFEEMIERNCAPLQIILFEEKDEK